MLIYGSAATALDVVAGHTGLLSLGHAAFFGLGAYAGALLGSAWHAGVLITSFAAVGLGVAGSLLLSLPALRLHDDYFVLGSFALATVAYSTAVNWTGVTRGAKGIGGIPALIASATDEGGFSRAMAAILAAGLTLLVVVLTNRTTVSGFGRALHAIREDERLAEAYGKDPFRLKVQSFALSCGICAAAGSFYAHYVRFVDPSLLAPGESIALLSMVVVGGAGSRGGAFLGAAVIVALPELLRLSGVPGPLAANLRQVLYGSMLTAMMLLRPRGLVGEYDFSKL